MKFVTDKPGQYPLLWEWMNKRTRLPWSTDLRIVGLMRDDNTVAAAVGYNNWTLDSCWMHVAFDNPHCMTRALIREAFEYPFVKCGMEAAYVMAPKSADDVQRLVMKLGYQLLTETVDGLMFEMKADDCRWLKEKAHGRQRLCTRST